MSKVINCKKKYLKQMGYRDLEHWLENPNHLYIGRNMSFYVPGAMGSKWANPFPVKKYGREGCLKEYRKYIKNNKELMNSLDELEGKVLACWCKPDGCHGDILIELLDQKSKTS